MLRLTVFKLLLSCLVVLTLIALSPLGQQLTPARLAQPSRAVAVKMPSATVTLPPPPSLEWPPTYTLTPSATFKPTSTEPPTATVTNTFTASPTIVPSPTQPEAHDVPAFRVRRQLLALDCEAASATQWAGYFGYKLNELDFQNALPRSDNPDYGFVGNVNDPWGGVPPQGYGVYAGPVADLLNKLGVPALAVKNYSLSQLVNQLAADRPVIVWVVGHVEVLKAYPYVDSRGRVAMVAAFEHVIIVTGYTPDEIHYISEGDAYRVSIPTFLKSWAVLGNMVVVAP